MSEFGAKQVWLTGIEIFGYPPTLEIGTKQVAELMDVLKQRQKQK